MPDALKLLATRRSFKAVELAGPAPAAAEIDTLLTIASRVPDHGKLTPWRFIVFEGEARRATGAAIAAAFRVKYPDAKPEHVEAELGRLLRAPLVIAMVTSRSWSNSPADGGGRTPCDQQSGSESSSARPSAG
ncbi:MAG TPA: nitroreductase family protein [Xanthobacteraceae bacterium]|jgi:nitroreductase|nr:nitroreductase family protein [Xanthobacteraceae bacterium]